MKLHKNSVSIGGKLRVKTYTILLQDIVKNTYKNILTLLSSPSMVRQHWQKSRHDENNLDTHYAHIQNNALN